MNLTFKGIRKPYILSANIKNPVGHEEDGEYIQVRNRPGRILRKRNIKTRLIPVEIWVDSTGFSSLEKLEEDFSEWLWSEREELLQFDGGTNRVYFAIAKVISKPIAYALSAQINILFECSDPFKYGSLEERPFSNGSAVINYLGTVENRPRFEFDVLSDITYLDIISDDGYMRLGRPVEIGQTLVQKYERMLTDGLASLTGWTSAGTQVDGGTVAGTFAVNSGDLIVSSYGTGTGWHGPSIKKSVPNAPLNDFVVELNFKFPNSITGRGRVECYLLDASSVVLAKFAMKRIGGGASGNVVEVRLGTQANGQFIVSDYGGTNGTAWREFEGIMRLTKEGNLWTFYVAMVDPVTGRHHTRFTRTYRDALNQYARSLAQVQLHAAQSGTIATPAFRLRNLTVDRINAVPDVSPAVIARAGDKIVVDHKRAEILINGEDGKHHKSFGASWFPLEKGVNTLLVEPRDSVTGKVIYREAFR